MGTVSPIDEEYYRLGRGHIDTAYKWVPSYVKVLEIGPREDKRKGIPGWDTLDIVPGCTYQADICGVTPIETSSFDCVICMDVLEHVVNPWAAIAEIRRILKPGGWLIAGTPFNFRIHGPLPDCWRFTEHGIKVLMKDWDDLEIVSMESDRFLAPTHYNWRAKCNKEKLIGTQELNFRWID